MPVCRRQALLMSGLPFETIEFKMYPLRNESACVTLVLRCAILGSRRFGAPRSGRRKCEKGALHESNDESNRITVWPAFIMAQNTARFPGVHYVRRQQLQWTMGYAIERETLFRKHSRHRNKISRSKGVVHTTGTVRRSCTRTKDMAQHSHVNEVILSLQHVSKSRNGCLLQHLQHLHQNTTLASALDTVHT